MKKILFFAFSLAVAGAFVACSNANKEEAAGCCGKCENAPADTTANEQIVAEQVDVEASEVVNEPDGKQVVENEVKLTPEETAK